MDYVLPKDARNMRGLRVSLTAGVPAPWSEAAKAMFKLKGLDYVPVLQVIGDDNKELADWTGHRNAPTAMYEDEPPRVSWLDILNLAERLEPEPSLFPDAIGDRVTMVGLVNEIAGENGMLWNARHLMFHGMVEAMGEEAAQKNPMIRDYRYSAEGAAAATHRIIAILEQLATALGANTASNYFFGERVSALDLYWACFSQILSVLPEEVNPMPDGARQVWGSISASLAADGYTTDSSLLAHRDFIFQEHIGLPLEF